MLGKPWIATQKWHHILFLHWPVPANILHKHIPPELDLDLFDGHAWIGFVFFKAKGTRPRFMVPIPGLHSYLELNVRTYVTFNGKSGVYFFNLDTDSNLAVYLNKISKFLPYRCASMSFSKSSGKYMPKSIKKHRGKQPEILDLSYKVVQESIPRNMLEYWLTERYCLWTKHKEKLIRVDIEHSSWRLHTVRCEIRRNSMAHFLKGHLQHTEPLAHYSPMKKVRFFPPISEYISS
ncbi:DUF2071 domain-containing protein [Sporosarcina sp. Marseille-Q4063]|uniref:YqjF family protein n=1 Tax=Sporosarcina sp. Marseille-Q4063 TaxID=2810514 RepID=UPI001BAF5D8F|nr:DUF2071 domain-containing protein [Sporosarcina sp. Marseille-Q4063]QUW22943.1 DUF2071 domain-containing protein [Sporosarcina sp. Marseille-Q4063]